MKISVIIAVYNVEKYIKQCLESVINQTLDDIEIICADDCSTDGSLGIIKEYSKKDSRIKVLEFRENKGPGIVRNKALDIAQGDYIMMLDGDDWLEPEACEFAYNQIYTNNNDIVFFNYYRYTEETKEKFPENYRLEPLIKYFDEPRLSLHELDIPFIKGCETWAQIYKKDFLNVNNIRYSEARIGEDVPFFMKSVVAAKSVSVLPKALYNYRKHLSAGTCTCCANWEDLFTSRELAFKYVCESKYYKDFLFQYSVYYINSIMYWYGRYSTKDRVTAEQFYNMMREKFTKLVTIFDVENIKSYIRYSKFKKIIQNDYRSMKNKKLLSNIFSLTNSGKHKVITFAGLKLKIKRVSKSKQYKLLKKKYKDNITRISLDAKSRKIRVGFYVNDTKWKCQNLYDLLVKNEHFEPFILVGKTFVKWTHPEFQTKGDIEEIYNSFKSKGMNVYMAFDFEKYKPIPLEKFKPDIIFYSRQWGLYTEHGIQNTSDYALSCYVPYFISNSSGKLEAGAEFHNDLWRYYVLNNDLVKEYRKYMSNRGDNLKVVGHPILDEYLKFETSLNKYVIYAPHWTVGGNTKLNYATFEWNGKYILDFAKNHPEFNWVFKPHPNLAATLVSENIMSEEEVKDYYSQWEEIGIKYEGFDYIEMFQNSRLLITDCGSFLAEYMPSKNPVILLHSNLAAKYNFLAEKVTKYYYKASNLEELKHLLEEVLISGIDKNRENRLKMLDELHLAVNASENILDDITNALNIN